MNLTDGQLTLRAVEPSDLDVLYRWENDTRLWKDGATIAPFSRTQLAAYIETYDPDIYAARQLRLMIELNGAPESIGAVDLYDFDPRNSRCGVGLLIDSDFRGNGYGEAALRILSSYCRNHLGIHQLYAIVGVDNLPSRSTFLQAGYKISGRLRSWIKLGPSYTDAYMMQQLLV